MRNDRTDSEYAAPKRATSVPSIGSSSPPSVTSFVEDERIGLVSRFGLGFFFLPLPSSSSAAASFGFGCGTTGAGGTCYFCLF